MQSPRITLEGSRDERGRAAHLRQQDDNEGRRILTQEERNFLNTVINDRSYNLFPSNGSWSLNEIETKVDRYFSRRKVTMHIIIIAIVVIIDYWSCCSCPVQLFSR